MYMYHSKCNATPLAGHVNDGRKRAPKRKASSDTERRPKKSKGYRDLTFNKDSYPKPKHIAVNNVQITGIKRKTSSADEQLSKKQKVERSAEAQKQQFEAKYTQQQQLGEGGYGSVFAGYRNYDNLQVAIKHIPKDNIPCKTLDGKGRKISVEVDIMLKLAAKKTESPGASAPVALLDSYDLGQELILVLERPIPCQDLFEYKEKGKGSLPEDKAKIIIKQLIEAAIDLHKKRIFHRDIKLENILIETGSDVPRVRIIDFGLSCYFKEEKIFSCFCGTEPHAPPEFLSKFAYCAGPTTVWQIGVVLFEMLHLEDFDTKKFMKEELILGKDLSLDCRYFFSMCLAEVPEHRLTLEELLRHPWLQ